MAKYTFIFDPHVSGVLRPYIFVPEPNATGAMKQFAQGKIFGKAFQGSVDTKPRMNVGLNDFYGRPVFCDLILQRSSKDTDRVELVNVLVTIDQKKKIVRTDLSGRNGSVIEYISMPSYDITIEGDIISNEVDVYPKDQAEALVRMLNEPETLGVMSEYLAMFSIYNLVITSYILKQENSKQSAQELTVKAISDELLELIIE